MKNLFKIIRTFLGGVNSVESSKESNFVSKYEIGKTNIPEGYSLKDDCLYWHDRKLDLPGEYYGAIVVNGVFIFTCNPTSSKSNVFGFDLQGNMLWTIDPVSYDVPYPAWGGAGAYQAPEWNDYCNAIVVYSLLGMYELDLKTGHIVRQILTGDDLR